MKVHTTAPTAATRRSVHGIAEHLMAGTQWRATRTIQLHIQDGALSTAQLPGPVSRIELRAGALVRYPDGLVVPAHGSFADVAARLGIAFGLVDGPYPPASGCGPQDVVVLDPAALSAIEDAWRVGDRALRRFSDQPPVVWPEHLDVAITQDEVNYGVSPGDDQLHEPYAYVGPHRPRTGPFWNAPFGASRPLSAMDGDNVPDLAELVADFFQQGRRLAADHPPR